MFNPPPPDPHEEARRKTQAHDEAPGPGRASERSAPEQHPTATDQGETFRIIGIEGMSRKQIADEVARGGRFVIFRYCISVIAFTVYNASDVYFVRAGEDAGRYSGRFSMLSSLFGWWGIPWGPIRTFQALAANSKGGEDVTVEVLASLGAGGGPTGASRQPQPRAKKRRRQRSTDDYGTGE